jgi:hypothetical protein
MAGRKGRVAMNAVALLLLICTFIAALIGYWEPLGLVLYRLDASALNTLQAGVQRHISGDLWDLVFVPILELPAILVPGLIGVVILLVVNLRREPV